MEITEQLPLLKIHFLADMSFKTFKDYCSSSMKEQDMKTKYDILQRFCQSHIQTKGTIQRIYRLPQNTPLEVGGRLYSPNSLQSLPKQFRGFLCENVMTDIDMKNAHVVIARYLCRLDNIVCPNIEYYINHRDEVLAEFGENGKELFLKALNDDKLNKKETNMFFKNFDKECKIIQKQIIDLPKYKHIVDSVPETKLYNEQGSAFNRIMCVYENKILQSLISFLRNDNINIRALCFDGLLMEGDYYDNRNLLDGITNHINNEFEGLNMKWSYKEHCSSIVIPLGWSIPNKQETSLVKLQETCEATFGNVQAKFEDKHCKIINKSFFLKEFENKVITLNKSQIISSYEHLQYTDFKYNGKSYEAVETQFIHDWLKCPTMRVYDEVGVFPTGLKCPSNYYNMWRPFDMELVTEWEQKDDAIEKIKKHILILSGNDENVCDYFIKWIAQMIQYPAVKSICPTLISKEGAGKGTLLQLLTKMIGSTKVFQTTQPSRDVWGEFNGLMAEAFLVNLDELGKKETIESEGRIKGLITEPTLKINNKGVAQFPIQSFHRFIITTNNEEPIKTTKDDRRKLVIKSSDELCGNKSYFNDLYALLDDVNSIKSCYEYFKSIPDMDKFNSLSMPVTQYQNDLKEMSVSPIESWIKDFTYDNFYEKEPIELLGKDAYKMFCEWTKKCGMDYNVTLPAFGLRIKNLNISGIKKGKHTNKGETKLYNIEILKKHFNIENIEVSDEQ